MSFIRATLGGDYDLRGFRNQRFLEINLFFSSDIRYAIEILYNSYVHGIFAGFDYGRVWLDGGIK
jgi:hemolysin activation/secretion protein